MEQIELLKKIANELALANKLKMTELTISVIKFDAYIDDKEKINTMKHALDEVKKIF